MATHSIDIEDFFKLRKQFPVIDVRSEGEFESGHIPQALNIPILNNAERVAVGTDYKQKGQLEAIRTGFRLVGPRLPEIIDAAQEVGEEFIVHCWRGGMRSNNFCQFVGMARQKTHQLKGGYKAYRQAALMSFEQRFEITLLSGSTGSGKSEILRALASQGEQVIDLETLASHKGSAFGGLMMPPQPSTEQFQNNLFEKILTLDPSKRVWIEDESIAIGKIFIPQPLWRQMNNSPVIEIDVAKEIRVQRLVNEYGTSNRDQFLEAMTKVIKKLGGQHFNAAKEKLLEGDMASTIDILLTYYDKAYRNNLDKKLSRVISKVTWTGESVDFVTAQLM
ncbi:tRNA 2-selenouridine(34) synthase MnmH [Pseudochryseolinea flava]|uniref:tRNA 2-selenouridine(34) synthase MnmH n=1 Tax=Pseudochryseolinea flava TaxID=2059302 RepID=UPI00140307E7|nr:tRNA 2-selenouridine(34) synthase MnmH [Pseudochryseolinea flava]